MAYLLTALNRYQEEIRKSRFIAIAAPVADAKAAQAFLTEHSDAAASHNCWAWLCGAQYRFSDDGEPGGTAGKPILSAIQHQGFDNTAVLVIRYYGGIQLGTGGLARAYGGCANKCLQSAARVELIKHICADCYVPFTELNRVQARLGLWQARIVHEAYDANGAQLVLELPEAQLALAALQLKDLSRGSIVLKARPL